MQLTNEEQRTVNKALQIIREKQKNYKTTFDTTEISKTHFKLMLGAEERECFAVAFLNSQLELIADEIMFKGTIDAASVWPREIVKRALTMNAKSIIIAHNHPSGKCEPSNADISITSKIDEACKLLQIELLDHIIVGNDCFSMQGAGMI